MGRLLRFIERSRNGERGFLVAVLILAGCSFDTNELKGYPGIDSSTAVDGSSRGIDGSNGTADGRLDVAGSSAADAVGDSPLDSPLPSPPDAAVDGSKDTSSGRASDLAGDTSSARDVGAGGSASTGGIMSAGGITGSGGTVGVGGTMGTGGVASAGGGASGTGGAGVGGAGLGGLGVGGSCAGVSGPDGGSACPVGTPVCAATGSCVECVSNSDCPTAGKAFCVQNQCQGCIAGGLTSQCSGATPICATTGTIAGQCVGCVSNTDCGTTTPICNGTNVCVPCTSDTQCTTGPGVCMFHQDGRCASDAETIYVMNSATCSGGAGTIASPYCDSQAGINAVTASKRVIVMSGSNLYPVTSTATSSTGQITIIGQSTATTTAGAFVGIHVAAGDVYVRGLTVASGTNAGLTVDAGATLRMDRCIVKGNAGGGLIVKSGANFDIANSVFDNNGPGLVGITTTYGGIYLGGSAPSAGPHRFWFNTVVNNQDRGIICFDTTQALTGMLLFGNTNGDFLSCAMDATSKWSSGSPTPSGVFSDITNPALSSTYHLTTASKCRDFVSASTAHPVDDMDGELRPKPANGKLDCGADEF